MNVSSLVIPLLLSAVAVYGMGAEGGCLQRSDPRRRGGADRSSAYHSGAGGTADCCEHVPRLRSHGISLQPMRASTGSSGHSA